jgi:hypothetical protein
MLGALQRVATAVVFWAVAALVLWWGRLPAPGRRTLALLTSAAGLVFLVLAVNTEGIRESPTVAVFLLGTPSVVEQVSASASLPYYVLTGVCLLLGTAGLAVRDDVAQRMERRWMASAVGLSLAVTLLRFALEKAAAPESWTYAVGIVWLIPVAGAWFAMNLRTNWRTVKPLAGSLLVYALTVRGFVALFMVVASTLRLGSHYDVSPWSHVMFRGQVYLYEPGSLAQILELAVVPQLVFWPPFTLFAGLLGAAVALGAAAVLGSRQPAASASVAGPEPARGTTAQN